MQVSRLSIIESLKGQLLLFPDLVNSLKNKDYNFLERLEEWMIETETILKNNNIAQCATIAGIRSKILAPIFDVTKVRSSKKKQVHIAAESMYEIQDIVQTVLKPFEQKVSEAKELLRHLLNIVKQSGAAKYTAETNFQDFINMIWRLFSTHEQLKSSTVSVLSLVSQTDAIRLMADEIEIQEWM